MMNHVTASSEKDDATLVSASLAGDREAFGQIVARYQSLVCSLTYSATGQICQSEDLAQETFLLAWRQLEQLREPPKFRSWLCRIARSVISNYFRRNQREPCHAAIPVEDLDGAVALEPLPTDQAISQEEEAILWRAVERIPLTYREPLVLYYRESHSIQRVAQQLDLSEDAVKQRLSRGRKLLEARVLSLVERSLAGTTPGKAFTLAVVTALPALAPTTSAAAVTALAAKGSPLAKAASTAGLVGTFAGPLLGLLGAWFGIHMSLKHTRSPRERHFMARAAGISVALVGVFGLGCLGLIYAGRSLVGSSRPWFIGLLVGWIVLYIAVLVTLVFWTNSRQRRIQLEDGTDFLVSPTAQAAHQAPTRKAIGYSLGGSIAGGSLWLMVIAGRAEDWWALTGILLTAALTFIGALRLSLRRPDLYFRAAAASAAILGGLAIATLCLRWDQWAAAEPELSRWTPGRLSLLLAGLYGTIALVFACRRAPFRSPGRRQPFISP